MISQSEYTRQTKRNIIQTASRGIMTGTINTMDGEYYAHLHMSAGNQKGEVFGGHLNRAIVSATCELVITVIDGRVDRVHDEETGLNIFKFN